MPFSTIEYDNQMFPSDSPIIHISNQTYFLTKQQYLQQKYTYFRLAEFLMKIS